jgi:hypothetical protein
MIKNLPPSKTPELEKHHPQGYRTKEARNANERAPIKR